VASNKMIEIFIVVFATGPGWLFSQVGAVYLNEAAAEAEAERITSANAWSWAKVITRSTHRPLCSL
jgi:hypothetical protein